MFLFGFPITVIAEEKTKQGHKEEEETCCGTGRRARLTVLQNEKSGKHTLARPGHVSRAARLMPSVTSPGGSTAKGSQWLGKHPRVPPVSAAVLQLPEPPNTSAPRFWVRKQAETCPRSLERQRPDSSPHSLTPKSLPADGLAKAAPRTTTPHLPVPSETCGSEQARAAGGSRLSPALALTPLGPRETKLPLTSASHPRGRTVS